MTHFELLNISPGASLDPHRLRDALRAFAREHHPDRNPQGAERMAQANVAFDMLADSFERRKYLAQLRSTHETCGTCAGTGQKTQQRGFKKVEFINCPVCTGFGYKEKAK